MIKYKVTNLRDLDPASRKFAEENINAINRIFDRLDKLKKDFEQAKKEYEDCIAYSNTVKAQVLANLNKLGAKIKF